MNPKIKEFSKFIKSKRKHKKMNQETLARISGLSRSKIAAIESLERKSVKSEDAYKIMKALGESFEEWERFI